MAKKSKSSTSSKYGFGASGIMAKEYFPYFMGFYCAAFFIVILIIMWKMKGYNKKKKKFRETLISDNLGDENATFVPQRQPSQKKKREHTKTDATEREGRPLIRKTAEKLLKKRAKEAKERAAMINQSTTDSEDDSEYTTDESY